MISYCLLSTFFYPFFPQLLPINLVLICCFLLFCPYVAGFCQLWLSSLPLGPLMSGAYVVKESCMIAWFESVPTWCNSDVTPQWAGWRRKVWHRAKKRLIWNQICKRKQLSWLLVTYRDTVYRIGQADPEQVMLPVLAQKLQENENWACGNSLKSTKKMSFSQADLTAIAPMLTPLQPYI